jgi:N-acylneuraminate cytidylyltransferase
MSNNVAIILARGGSKGIPKKNIIDFCGKPLIAWTIEQCFQSKSIKEVWVSSDSSEILSVAEQYGARTIKRPGNISDDFSSSESAWLHAIKIIKEESSVDLVFAPQVTSPLRDKDDIDNAFDVFERNQLDSLFSGSVVEDLFFWERNNFNILESVNYDYLNRKRRQDIKEKIIENGSFYIFSPDSIEKSKNRLSGTIGCSKMESWKLFEIDSFEDLKVCQALMFEFLIKD